MAVYFNSQSNIQDAEINYTTCRRYFGKIFMYNLSCSWVNVFF